MASTSGLPDSPSPTGSVGTAASAGALAEPSGLSLRGLWQSPWSERIVRWALAAAFVSAGAIKAADPRVFAVTIDAFGILPHTLVAPVSRTLPWVEITAGLALAANIRGALAVVCGLLAVFIAILAYGLHLGLDIDCGCYGPADPEAKAFSTMRTSLARDVVMLAAAAFVYLWRCCNHPRLVRPLHGLISLISRATRSRPQSL